MMISCDLLSCDDLVNVSFDSAVTLQSDSICQNNIANASSLSPSLWASYVQNGTCTAYVYQTKSALYRCLPTSNIPLVITSGDSSVTVANNATMISASGIATQGSQLEFQVLADLLTVWYLLVIALGVACLVSFVWIGLMRFFSGPFVWISVILSNVGLVGSAVWLYFYWQQVKSNYSNAAGTTQSGCIVSFYSLFLYFLFLDITVSTQTAASDWEVKTAQGVFIADAIIAGIVLLATIGLFKKLKMSIELIKDTSRAVAAMPLLCNLSFLMYSALSFLDLACHWRTFCILCVHQLVHSYE